MPIGTFTAILHREGELYVAECPEVGTVSQGKSVEEAVANLEGSDRIVFGRVPPENSGRPLVTVSEARYA